MNTLGNQIKFNGSLIDYKNNYIFFKSHQRHVLSKMCA